MPGRVVVQWDKDDCADLGLVKVDLLGLGMMAVLQDALAIVNRSTSPPVDLAHLPPDDPEVYHLLQTADTIGVFQVESRAQMATLPRLKPTCFYDIVVEVAIIRPGPIVGQMVHPYLNRRRGGEPVTYPHPSLEPVLERTLGVPLFQEQLLRIAMVVANFTGGEAEELRRAMGFKRSEARMRAIEVRLRDGHGQQRHHRRRRRRDRPGHLVVRALRLSRIARRQLRADRLRQRLSEGATIPARVLRRAPQQPADGVLPPGDAGQGCPAPRRALPADRRAGVAVGLRGRGRRRDPHRPALRRRAAGRSGAADCGSAFAVRLRWHDGFGATRPCSGVRSAAATTSG